MFFYFWKILLKLAIYHQITGRQITTLREKRPNREFFLVRIFLYSVQIQENTDQKKLSIWKFFTQCDNVKNTNYGKLP